MLIAGITEAVLVHFMYNRVEWFSTFFDFLNLHAQLQITLDQVFFRSSIPKKRRSQPLAHMSHKKPSLYVRTSKSNHKKFNLNLKFAFFKKWQKRFLICTRGKQISFSSVLAFKQVKEHIWFQVQPLKMYRKYMFFSQFRVTSAGLGIRSSVFWSNQSCFVI